MEVFAGFGEYADTEIGQLVEAIKAAVRRATPAALIRHEFHLAGIDQHQAADEYSGAGYLSDRPITAISSDIFAR